MSPTTFQALAVALRCPRWGRGLWRKGKTMRAVPFMPYLSFQPSAWVLPLMFEEVGIASSSFERVRASHSPARSRDWYGRSSDGLIFRSLQYWRR